MVTSDFTALHILEDTPTLHHVVTCTLCSCYPRPILGNSPEWYRTPNYRRRIVRTPRQVLAEFGLFLSPEIEIRVEDSNSKHRFLVLPVRPAGTEGWNEEQLAAIVTLTILDSPSGLHLEFSFYFYREYTLPSRYDSTTNIFICAGCHFCNY